MLTPGNKEKYRLLCEEKGKIVGAMPYHLLKKWGFRVVIQPQLTQYNGVWIDCPENIKPHKRYSFEKRITDNLIDQLEKLKPSFYYQNFHHSFTDWQPFYWRNFKQTTRYTYVLENIADLDTVFDNIHPRYRQRIRKSEQEFTIDFNILPEEFYDFHKKSLQQHNNKIEYSSILFYSIYYAAIQRETGKIIAIRNRKNELLSALFFVWDKNTGYNLITARKIIDGSNDASIFMIWQAIKYLKNKTQNYDFEGSMISGVAAVNQQFGAKQVPYFNISKSYSCIFDLLFKLKR